MEQDHTDLDETRRLLYMAKAAHRTKRYNLVGTLTNALVHHSQLESDADSVISKLIDVVEGTAAPGDLAWVDSLVSTLADLAAGDATEEPGA
jgi:hypothetical protein